MGEALKSERLLLRPGEPTDLDPLVRILSQPEVSQWWHGFDRGRVRSELIAQEPGVTVFVLQHRDEILGAIQFDEETDPDYRHANLDLFVAVERWGQGFGAEAIRALANHLVRARGHHRLVIDPAAANLRAIRTYEKVGFRPVGRMRQYERGPDGTWHDGLLMEALASDLR